MQAGDLLMVVAAADDDLDVAMRRWLGGGVAHADDAAEPARTTDPLTRRWSCGDQRL
jgi:hypothetical protein